MSAWLSEVAAHEGTNLSTAPEDGEVPIGDATAVEYGVEQLVSLLGNLRCLLRQWSSLKDAAGKIEICSLAALPQVPCPVLSLWSPLVPFWSPPVPS